MPRGSTGRPGCPLDPPPRPSPRARPLQPSAAPRSWSHARKRGHCADWHWPGSSCHRAPRCPASACPSRAPPAAPERTAPRSAREIAAETSQGCRGRDAGSPSGSARRPICKSHVPACGSKTPPWRSHTPRCPAEPQGGKRLSQSHDSSWSSRKGPDHRSPRPQTAPGASSAATRPPTEVTEIRFHGRSGGNCSSIAHQSITCSALPRVYPTPPRRVKSDRLLGISNALRLSLVGWSKTLAREVGRDGITANIVLPGRIATKRILFLDQAKAERENRPVEEVTAESTGSVPVGRYGYPEEYADVVTFLASERASYVTGSVIRVDGGLIASI